MDLLFARKIPNADLTQSEDFFITENLLSIYHFLVACSLHASATARHVKKAYFMQQIAYYRALTENGIDWRAYLKNILEQSAPEFMILRRRSAAVLR